jgi:hypothetical protein
MVQHIDMGRQFFDLPQPGGMLAQGITNRGGYDAKREVASMRASPLITIDERYLNE